MHRPGYFQLVSSAIVNPSSTGDKTVFQIVEPCTVYEAGFLVTSAIAGTGLGLSFDRRPTAGSDSGRGTADVALVSSTGATQAQGKCVRKDVSVNLNKGDEVVVEVTTASSGGGVFAYLKCIAGGQGALEADDVASV